MGRLFKKEAYTPEEKARIDEWYQEMKRQMEWDSQFEDFTESEEWDKDFRQALEEGFEKGKRKRRRKRVLVSTALGMMVVMFGSGLMHREVIGECLNKVFENYSKEAGLNYEHFGTKEDLLVIGDGEQTRLSYEGKTLSEIYLQMKNELKRPFFQIADELGEYEVIDAYYEDVLRLLVINLETEEGKVYMSQEEQVDSGGTGANVDEEGIVVWNDNLKQEIVIKQSIQDASYSFFAQQQGIIFNFHGFVSLEMCNQIARTLVFR